jgi:hypothetical protein
MSWNNNWWARKKREDKIALPPIHNVRVTVKKSPDLITCPHCLKKGKAGGGMKRWHFDNCTNKKGRNDGDVFLG